MRKLAFLLLFAASAPAFAADLPVEKGAPPPPPPPVFSWTGFYFGVTVGYAESDDPATTQGTDSLYTDPQIGQTVPPSFGFNTQGFAGGGQAGFNYEFPTDGSLGIVVGLESDFDYMGAGIGSQAVDSSTGTYNFYHTHLYDLGTTRARLGIAINDVLVYGTGGFAYGESTYSHSFTDQAKDPIWAGSSSSFRTGWVFGGGVEYAIPTPALGPGALTIRGEFLHYDLGTQTTNIPYVGSAAIVPPFIDHYHVEGNVLRAGLNYLFDFAAPPAPVVSKY
jgi:outer membrane immunogenic protein